MQKTTRISKSFTPEGSIVSYVQNTRGSRSNSERVNELLRKAILQERYERLDQEAGEFFSSPSERERAEAKAFQKASMRSFSRDAYPPLGKLGASLLEKVEQGIKLALQLT